MTDRPVLLYLHIPKTAGTSLTEVIYNQYNDATGSRAEADFFCNGVYYYPGEPELSPARWGGPWAWKCAKDDSDRIARSSSIVRAVTRNDLQAVVGHFGFGLHTIIDKPTTYMTIFRHPVERIASLFHHLARWPSYGNNEPWLKLAGLSPLSKDVTLGDFIRDYRLCDLDNDQTRRVAGEDPEFGRCTRSLLELAKANIEQHFSFVGVTERFNESLKAAADVLKWPNQPKAEKKLANEHREETSLIPLRTREAILERNTLDLELYSFANKWLNDCLRTSTSTARNVSDLPHEGSSRFNP